MIPEEITLAQTLAKWHCEFRGPIAQDRLEAWAKQTLRLLKIKDQADTRTNEEKRYDALFNEGPA